MWHIPAGLFTLLPYSMEQSPSWEANQQTLILVKKFPAFMEPESSSPYPQVPATRPYPEPTLSSTHDPLQLPEDPSKYYPPIYVLVSPMASFPQASPLTPCAPLYPPPYAPHALPISFVSILPPAQYWVRSTDHSAPRYAASSIPLPPRPS